MPETDPKGQAPTARTPSTTPQPAQQQVGQPKIAQPKPTQAKPAQSGDQPTSRSRSRHRGRNNRRKNDAPGQISQGRRGEVTPPVTAPPSRGRNKRPLAEPRIGVGCIVMRGDEVLIVRERGRWSLPKGGLEVGELLQEGARRETYEETGLIVELRELAFLVEFQAETWGHHLQFFYVGREVGGTLGPRDPDRDVQEAKFVSVRHLREYLRFRPRLVALEAWLRDRRPKHFVFDLDKEPAMLKKRSRVQSAAPPTHRGADSKAQLRESPDLERLTFEAPFDDEDELP
ncbi:NUDIX hydrolase [Deinococcus rubellus]|uniref:NUDIX hydrolase n=1 Tax=Deinococcus rubellus TaxID=1889240 RepID=A0ABY5YKS9_9DEIO|nr:NUDIX hydrolase [Deinococcus rubellus]UWX65428.1 NUDIX hydrolase [Deinococcus rubellus]